VLSAASITSVRSAYFEGTNGCAHCDESLEVLSVRRNSDVISLALYITKQSDVYVVLTRGNIGKHASRLYNKSRLNDVRRPYLSGKHRHIVDLT